jgi:OHCU decarboxylase
MTSALERLNDLPSEEAEARLLSCCGSRKWARRLGAERPFGTLKALAESADRIWRSLSKEDWLEAFATHPRIGGEKGSVPISEKGSVPISGWARGEQAGTKSASAETLAHLAEANREYEKRFGHIFIVCASGKTAAEMLADARARLHNDPQTELAIAADEQRKITRLRLAKLLEAEEA